MKAINKMNRLALKELDSAGLVLTLQRLILDQPETFDSIKTFEAVSLATYLHRAETRDVRANLPRTPYIEHPLRNTIRLLRLDCYCEDTIISTILHDILEDCAEEITREFRNMDTEGMDEHELRRLALAYIQGQYGSEVARLVLSVSNEILPDGTPVAEKNIIYCNHAGESIQDPKSYLVKYSDLMDNAASLYHHFIEGGDNTKVIRRAVKYLPLIDVFETTHEKVRDRLPVSEDAKEEILATLLLTRSRLNRIINHVS